MIDKADFESKNDLQENNSFFQRIIRIDLSLRTEFCFGLTFLLLLRELFEYTDLHRITLNSCHCHYH